MGFVLGESQYGEQTHTRAWRAYTHTLHADTQTNTRLNQTASRLGDVSKWTDALFSGSSALPSFFIFYFFPNTRRAPGHMQQTTHTHSEESVGEREQHPRPRHNFV